MKLKLKLIGLMGLMAWASQGATIQQNFATTNTQATLTNIIQDVASTVALTTSGQNNFANSNAFLGDISVTNVPAGQGVRIRTNGTVTATGQITAGSFSGSGVGLTSIPIAGIVAPGIVITNGDNQPITVSNRWTFNDPANNNLTISNGVIGTMGAATNRGNIQSVTFNATTGFNGPGAGLTGLNASQVTSGTLPNGVMPLLSGPYPQAITNNDTRGPTVSSILNIASGIGDTIKFGANSGLTLYGFSGGFIMQGNGITMSDQAGNQIGLFGSGGISGGVMGATTIGGPNYNYGSVNMPYLAGTLGRMTNYTVSERLNQTIYPAPILAFNSYYNMALNPNGAWATNTIGVVNAWGWYQYGWSNIWYDDGVLTNRVGGHLTASSAAFPQGVGVVVAYATNNGFNIGAYLAHAPTTCGGGNGTADENISDDVTDISALGFSLLKVDNCGGGSFHGLSYQYTTADYEARHSTLFPWINQMQGLLGRRPMTLLTTESSQPFGNKFTWYPAMMDGFNICENGSPNGGAAFGGTLTNFVTEQTEFRYLRPGHTFRFSSPGGTTATSLHKEFFSFCVLTPSCVIVPTNINSANSVYYTNPIVNGILLSAAAFTEPGFQISTNAATGVSAFSRPLGPLNGLIRTGSKAFNGGYDFHGGAYSNIVLIENLSAGAQTATVTWGQLGIPSNTWVSVTELWGSDGKTPTVMSNSWNTYQESISSGDCKLYSFNTFSIGASVPEYNSYLATNIVMNTATLSNVNFNATMLVQSGKKYHFEATLILSDSVAADGAKIDFSAGTATAADFRAHGCLIHDTGGTTNLAAATSTTLAGAMNIATMATVNQHVLKVTGSFEPSSTGTFGPRFCQNTHSTGSITLFRGSNLILTEAP